MTRSNPTALRRRISTSLLIALLFVLATSLFGDLASAAPRDDIGGVGDDIVVVDDPTQTPLPEPELTPVAIPSVSPEPTRDPLDVTGDQADEIYDDPGTGDMIVTSEVCNPIVPGQVNEKFCSPAPSEGYDAYLYSGTSNHNYTIAYQGDLPVDLQDLPAGPYMLSVGPIPVLTQLQMMCRVESPAGDLIQTLTGTTFITLSLGYDRDYRCTVYSLPEGERPDEIQSTDGPAELVITDFFCPAGTDPALNYFGLIGRCGIPNTKPLWEARTSAGHHKVSEQIDDNVVRLGLDGAGPWTLSTYSPSGSHPPILFCNVRDEIGNEPPAYAPFMTYTYGPAGAVIQLEQHLTWNCVSYTIPTAVGTGSDVAQVTSTVHACPEGTVAPTVAACAQTMAGVTVHLLYGTETIVATRQTDAAGVVGFAAPQNLAVFGLAQEIPVGYAHASSALCSKNGGAPAEYAVSSQGVIDLGGLTGGDTVSCSWFNVADSSAVAPDPLELEIADVEDLELAPEIEDGQDGARDDSDLDEFKGDSGVDTPQGDSGEDALPTKTPESGGIVPLEEDE